MGLQNHEKFIQDKMKNYQVNLEGDDLWHDLEAFVPQEEKRRSPLLILLVGAFIGLFIGVVLFSTNYFTNKNNGSITVNHKSTQSPESILITDTNSNTNYNFIKDDHSALNTYSMDVAPHTTNASVKVSKIPLNTIFSDNSETHSIPMNRASREKFETSNSKAMHPSFITSSTSDSYVSDMMQDVLSDPRSITEEKSASLSEDKFSSVLEKDTEVLIESNERDFLDIVLLPSPDVDLFFVDNHNTNKAFSIVQCPLEKISRWNIYLMAGSTYSRTKFLPGVDNNYMHLYNNSHTSKFSWATELGINYLTMPNWGITASVTLNNLTSQIRYQYHTLEKEAKGTEKVILITTNGSKVDSNEDVSVVTKKTYDGTWYNHRLQAGLKTGLFYEFKLPYALSLNCQLGMYTNIYTKQYGHFLTDEFSIEQASAPMNDGIQLNMNPYTSLGIHYTWNNGLKTGININYVTLKSKYNNKIIRDHIYNIGLVCRYPIN